MLLLPARQLPATLAAGFAYVSFVAFWSGDMTTILYGTDAYGNRCGIGDFSSRPKIVYPQIEEDVAAQAEARPRSTATQQQH